MIKWVLWKKRWMFKRCRKPVSDGFSVLSKQHWSETVTTVTVPTPICPIPTFLHPSRVIRIIPKHPMPLPNPLAPSWANSCLSNALPNTPTPLHLVDAFPTRCTFDLSSSSCQVNFQYPHLFLIWRLSTFTFLHQVYSQCLIGLMTVVGRSPITYLPRSMCLSLSFLTLYISVCSSMPHRPLPSFHFCVSSSVPHLCPPLLNLSLFYLSVDPL